MAEVLIRYRYVYLA